MGEFAHPWASRFAGRIGREQAAPGDRHGRSRCSRTPGALPGRGMRSRAGSTSSTEKRAANRNSWDSSRGPIAGDDQSAVQRFAHRDPKSGVVRLQIKSYDYKYRRRGGVIKAERIKMALGELNTIARTSSPGRRPPSPHRGEGFCANPGPICVPSSERVAFRAMVGNQSGSPARTNQPRWISRTVRRPSKTGWCLKACIPTAGTGLTTKGIVHIDRTVGGTLPPDRYRALKHQLAAQHGRIDGFGDALESDPLGL